MTRLTCLVLGLLAATLLVTSAGVDWPVAEADEGQSNPRFERITNIVPWPRGVRFVDGKLYAIARGPHRSAGGPHPDIDDKAGCIFEIDPSVSEQVVPGQPPGAAVVKNGKVIAVASEPPFQLWDRKLPNTDDTTADRPYAQLVYDKISQNFFFCGFSGVDLPKKQGGFRKNATDCILRYDMRMRRYFEVDRHNHLTVPKSELKKVVDPKYYPHHDVANNPPPHGLVNGACGADVVGDFLYVGAKDNTALVQYDLRPIRKNPLSGPPPGKYIFHRPSYDRDVFVQVKGQGSVYVEGTSAVGAHDGWLYVCFRTTSQILRFSLTENGDLVRPLEAEQVAQFKRYDPKKKGGSANIYDIAFDSKGFAYVSPGYDGKIYRFKPVSGKVEDFTDGYADPYVDIEKLAGAKKTVNICFDAEDNLYISAGKQEIPNSNIRGVIYRYKAR